MKFTMTVETDSDDRNLVGMVARVAAKLSDGNLHQSVSYPVIDENGNCVGHFSFEDESCDE